MNYYLISAPLPPKRDPKTTLSVGRARARSMVAGLAEIGKNYLLTELFIFFYCLKNNQSLNFRIK